MHLITDEILDDFDAVLQKLLFRSDLCYYLETYHVCRIVGTKFSINQSVKIYIVPFQDTYSEALPTQAKRKFCYKSRGKNRKSIELKAQHKLLNTRIWVSL